MRLLIALIATLSWLSAANAAGTGVTVLNGIPGTSPGVAPPAGSTVEVQPTITNMVSGTANTPAAATTTTLLAAVASRRLYITAYSCHNTGATPALISFQDGSNGPTIWTTLAGAGS